MSSEPSSFTPKNQGPPSDSDEFIQSSRNFRFWPIFALCFLRTFFFSLYSLALPNYLIFAGNVPARTVGLISSMSSIAYIFGPIFGRKLTKEIGIKLAILLSTILSFLSIIFSIFFIIPWVLLIVRALDGFVTGFFWPNVINLISSWEKQYESSSEINLLKRFNNSWNSGLISGYIFGYIFVQYLGSDFTILIISAGLSFFMIPTALLLEKGNEFTIINNRAVIIQDFKIRSQHIQQKSPPLPSTSVSRLNTPLEENPNKYAYSKMPIVMAYLAIVVYASAKSIIKFALPYHFKFAELNSSWVYFVVLFQQVLQIVGLNIMSSLKTKKYAFFSGLSTLLLVSVLIMLDPGIIIIAGLAILSGLAVGLMQGLTQRIVMDYTKARNSTKYTMINEMSTGIAFGIMPVIAGFLLEINMIWDYVLLIGILLVVGAIILNLSNKYIQTYEKGTSKEEKVKKK